MNTPNPQSAEALAAELERVAAHIDCLSGNSAEVCRQAAAALRASAQQEPTYWLCAATSHAVSAVAKRDPAYAALFSDYTIPLYASTVQEKQPAQQPQDHADLAAPSGLGHEASTADKLHAAIINLPCKPLEMTERMMAGDSALAYKLGHRDARHAAAELALASHVPSHEARPHGNEVSSVSPPGDGWPVSQEDRDSFAAERAAMDKVSPPLAEVALSDEQIAAIWDEVAAEDSTDGLEIVHKLAHAVIATYRAAQGESK